MTDTFRALCAELSFIWGRSTNPDDLFENMIPLVARARVALAQPEPVAPPDEALLASVRHFYGDQAAADMGAEDDLRTARAVLARWGTPANQPVPVSERLPGPEDCTAQGWCWVLYRSFATWTLEPPLDEDGKHTGYTYWLPHHALPMPAPANNTREENLNG
jgi:hypothetical protein